MGNRGISKFITKLKLAGVTYALLNTERFHFHTEKPPCSAVWRQLYTYTAGVSANVLPSVCKTDENTTHLVQALFVFMRQAFRNHRVFLPKIWLLVFPLKDEEFWSSDFFVSYCVFALKATTQARMNIRRLWKVTASATRDISHPGTCLCLSKNNQV